MRTMIYRFGVDDDALRAHCAALHGVLERFGAIASPSR